MQFQMFQDDISFDFDERPKPRSSQVELNPDGYSVKGCSIIYAPAGQAGEYAKLSANPFRGCGHACVYCYVPLVLKMSRAEFDAGAIPRPDFIANLTKDARKYRQAGIREQVMLSFTTDPYNPGDVERKLTRQTIEVIKAHGLGFCTLTKGGRRRACTRLSTGVGAEGIVIHRMAVHCYPMSLTGTERGCAKYILSFVEGPNVTIVKAEDGHSVTVSGSRRNNIASKNIGDTSARKANSP